MKTYLVLISFLFAINSLSSQVEYSDWFTVDGNVCDKKVEIRYRYIAPSARAKTDKPFELQVQWKNNYSEDIHFIFEIRAGDFFWDGGKTVKAKGNTITPYWGATSYKVTPRVAIKNVYLGAYSNSHSDFECNQLSGKYQLRQ